jgi:hypothetical protein
MPFLLILLIKINLLFSLECIIDFKDKDLPPIMQRFSLDQTKRD